MQTEDVLNWLYSKVNKERKLDMLMAGFTCRCWKRVGRYVIGMLQLIIINLFITIV